MRPAGALSLGRVALAIGSVFSDDQAVTQLPSITGNTAAANAATATVGITG